ncbi:hypothetical protein Q8G31_27020 [Priestia megaterium]|uniref:hypothetical protein n=1 Tax=Priestia megaterium TaxID=1404 RepID=UPI0027309D21|nr:hypothetical protein [Priestia megaterium]MDP1383371.1 hypothetical protein [Priestia megaterium]MDP1427519.1 hypothetical protein [Priestia megaterium]
MTCFYFVRYSAKAVVGRQRLITSMEHSTKTEITSMEPIQTMVDEISTHHQGGYIDFTVIGLHLLHTEEQPLESQRKYLKEKRAFQYEMLFYCTEKAVHNRRLSNNSSYF